MWRGLLVLIAASAIYGFSIGLWHSLAYALRNLLKFPLLILVTATICTLACFLSARLFSRELSFRDVLALFFRLFKDTALLLSSLAAINLFLALTLEQPVSEHDLRGYPLFQGLNVVFIAICGSTALVLQTRNLIGRHGIGRGTSAAIIASWLAFALVVGGQWAWYLRPFFGIAALPSAPHFCHGTLPDFRGSTNFFEAVVRLVLPP